MLAESGGCRSDEGSPKVFGWNGEHKEGKDEGTRRLLFNTVPRRS